MVTPTKLVAIGVGVILVVPFFSPQAQHLQEIVGGGVKIATIGKLTHPWVWCGGPHRVGSLRLQIGHSVAIQIDELHANPA